MTYLYVKWWIPLVISSVSDGVEMRLRSTNQFASSVHVVLCGAVHPVVWDTGAGRSHEAVLVPVHCPLSRVAAQNRQSSHVVWLQSVLTTNYLFFSRMNETEYRSIDQKRTLSLGDRPYKVGRFTNFPSYWGAWRKFSENSSTLGGKEIGWNKKFKIKKGCIFQKEKNGSDQK